MRPVVRGRSFAISSMKPEGSVVAEQILRRGGNAFDAAVAAQAVLSLVDASNNGIGSDAWRWCGMPRRISPSPSTRKERPRGWRPSIGT